MAGTIKAGRAMVKVYADRRELTRGLAGAKQQLRAFSASVSRIGRSMMAFSVAAAIPFAFAVRKFSAFADQMAEVKAVTGAVADEFKCLY